MNKYWFIFCGDEILLRRDETKLVLPFCETSPVAVYSGNMITELPSMDGYVSCGLVFSCAPDIGDDYCFISLRESYFHLSSEHYAMAGIVRQLSHWEQTSRYCPSCGSEMVRFDSIHGKRCPSCGNEAWPHITPAVIVLVRRTDRHGHEQILLVRAHNFKGDFHGLVAGFVEVGETLEECVVREVYEETRLKIKNIRYFGSQTWPYPSGLMVGFIADYCCGEIVVQDSELKSASWYTKDNLPKIPEKLSIARRLIDFWLEHQG